MRKEMSEGVRRTYYSWKAMRLRCNNPNHQAYKRYAGMGIKICGCWSSFEKFLADMGERPDGTTLDRVNNDGDYEPENCRWATWSEQNKNRRDNRFIEFAGKRLTLPEWGRELGGSQNVIDQRLRSGWTVEKALTTPIRKRSLA
jgi:hypothetical protein